MKMSFTVQLFTINTIIILCPRQSEAAHARETRMRQRGKILRMDIELVKDVKMKVKSVQHIKRTYHKNIVFQIGEMIYDIRKKFRRMLYLLHYSETQSKTRRIENLVECQQLNMDIDKIIHMIEEYEWARSKKSEARDRVAFILRAGEQRTREKKRETLRQEIAKISSGILKVPKRERHLEDGFDTEY